MSSIARHEARRAWVVVDPERALTYFEETLTGEHRRDMHDLWRALADASPAEAFELAAKIDDPNVRREREDSIIRSIQWVDPLSAINWVIEHREGDTQIRKVGDILGSWAREDPAKVFDYLGSLPESFHTEDTYEEIGSGVGRGHHNDVLEWLQSVPKDQRDDFLGGALADMAYHHSDKVMTLVKQMHEGAPREKVMTELAERLASLDLAKASTWLAELPSSRSRDVAIREFTRGLSQSDPEAAAIWAADIDDPRLRRGSLSESLRTWMRKNESAARAWIEAQPPEVLSKAEKSAALRER